jgi:hypothetical protein
MSLCSNDIFLIHVPPAPSSTPTSFPDVVTMVGDEVAKARPSKNPSISCRAVKNKKLMCFIVLRDQERAGAVLRVAIVQIFT